MPRRPQHLTIAQHPIRILFGVANHLTLISDRLVDALDSAAPGLALEFVGSFLLRLVPRA